MEKGAKLMRAEGLLRLLAVLLLVMTACVLGFNRQTKTILAGLQKKVTVKDLLALWVLTIVASCAAAYELIQFCKCLFVARRWCSPAGGCSSSKGDRCLAWTSLILDQGVMYVMLGSTAAGTQASLIAVTGVDSLQWRKACNIYTRFCEQVCGGIVCGLVAVLAMCFLSSISAYRLFSTHYAGGSSRGSKKLASPSLIQLAA